MDLVRAHRRQMIEDMLLRLRVVGVRVGESDASLVSEPPVPRRRVDVGVDERSSESGRQRAAAEGDVEDAALGDRRRRSCAEKIAQLRRQCGQRQNIVVDGCGGGGGHGVCECRLLRVRM